MGAAHWLAQWARWKTVKTRHVSIRTRKYSMTMAMEIPLTLLNAVLAGALAVLVLLLLGHTLDALVIVVLVRGAVGRVGALCLDNPS